MSADDDATARQQAVDIALSFVGCSAAPATRAAYTGLLCTAAADYTDPAARTEASQQSGCARTVLGFWFNAGLRHPLLLERYRRGLAVVDVQMVARAGSAWRPVTWPLGAGDVVIIDGPAGPHVLTALASPDEAGAFDTVEGGQRDGGGFEAILRRRRHVTAAGRLDGYPVIGVVDWPALARCEQW